MSKNGFAGSALFGLALLVAAPAFGEYDELPEGPPAELARLYFSALALPGVAEWDAGERAALLDIATLRHRGRLVDRPPVRAALSASHVSRLARSDLVRANPRVLARACAQFGLVDGPCAAHAGYVRRALVLEEMLAQGQLTLDRLESDLVGAPRRGLGEAPVPR